MLQIYNDLKNSAIIMGVFGTVLIVFSIWFSTITKGSPLEVTSYILGTVGVLLIGSAIYAYQYRKPVLSFDTQGFSYFSFVKKPVTHRWRDVASLKYTPQPWQDLPNTITIEIVLQDSSTQTIGLRQSLIYRDNRITAKQAFKQLYECFARHKL